jgi:hypothetical protein
MRIRIDCPRSGKRCYGERDVALMQAERLGQRAYPCVWCGCWHLTSRLVDSPPWKRARQGEP